MDDRTQARLQAIIDRWSVGDQSYAHGDITTLLAEINHVRGALHHVKRMADGSTAVWHIADCALEHRPVPRHLCADEFAPSASEKP